MPRKKQSLLMQSVILRKSDNLLLLSNRCHSSAVVVNVGRAPHRWAILFLKGGGNLFFKGAFEFLFAVFVRDNPENIFINIYIFFLFITGELSLIIICIIIKI